MEWPRGYACAPELDASSGSRSLRAIQWDDRTAIREWRNDQIEVLRQAEPLTTQAQDAYFQAVLLPQLSMAEPPQVLLAFLDAGELVGYGGFVHIAWGDHRAEISFLSETARAADPHWQDEWRAYIPLMASIARERLGLHRLTAETFEFRTDVLAVMAELGFEREGVLRQHHLIDGEYCDSILTGMLLD